VWGAIIAASQVLTAVKPYLPFEQRLKATGELASKFERLFLQFESTWHDVAEGNISDKQINEKLTKLNQLATDAFESCIKSPLPLKQSLRERAAAIATEYFINIYT